MRPASLARRLARPALIASLTSVAVLATAFDVPGMHTPATPAREDTAPTAVRTTISPSPRASKPAPLICVDPGHSFTKPGMAVSVQTADGSGRLVEHDLREVEINLDVAQEVVRRLRARFGDDAVVMTWGEIDGRSRTWNALRGPVGDEQADVMARGAFCVAHDARSVVSIHTNWFGDEPNGVYLGFRDDNDRALAEALHDPLLNALAIDPRGRLVPDFKDYGLDPGDWFLMLGFGSKDVPATVIEPVMMSNADEARRLLPTIAAAPNGRRAQIAAVEARTLGDWIASTLLAGR